MTYTLTEDVVALPTGAWAGAHRRTLRFGDRPVLALSQGKHRNYVYPLFTPLGFAVTSEHPADHPHHNSFWFAAARRSVVRTRAGSTSRVLLAAGIRPGSRCFPIRATMRTCRGSSRIGRGDVGPFRVKGALVRRGEALKARYRVLVHDGDADAMNVAGAYDEYLRVTR